jgi:hypothetical protein
LGLFKLSEKVLIVKGNYRNFVKSLCDALKTGYFLWGFQEGSEQELTKIEKYRDALIVFYVNEHGFAMIARVGEVLYGDIKDLYWPDEIEKNEVKYKYRFTLIPIKVSRCFLEDAELYRSPEKVADKSCFVEHKDVVGYINKECADVKINTLILPSSVIIVKHECVAQKLVEYLDKQEEVSIKIIVANIAKFLSTATTNDAVHAFLRVVGRVARGKDHDVKEAVNAVLTNAPEHVRIAIADALTMLRQRIEPAVKVLAPCSENIASVLQDPDLVLGALAVSLATDSLGSDVVKEVIDAANSVVRENLFVVMLCRLYNPRVLG